MQVHELIEILQTVDPHLYITVWDYGQEKRYDITNNDIDTSCVGIFEFNINTSINEE